MVHSSMTYLLPHSQSPHSSDPLPDLEELVGGFARAGGVIRVNGPSVTSAAAAAASRVRALRTQLQTVELAWSPAQPDNVLPTTGTDGGWRLRFGPRTTHCLHPNATGDAVAAALNSLGHVNVSAALEPAPADGYRRYAVYFHSPSRGMQPLEVVFDGCNGWTCGPSTPSSSPSPSPSPNANINANGRCVTVTGGVVELAGASPPDPSGGGGSQARAVQTGFVDVVVTFSHPVVVDTHHGRPTLRLDVLHESDRRVVHGDPSYAVWKERDEDTLGVLWTPTPSPTNATNRTNATTHNPTHAPTHLPTATLDNKALQVSGGVGGGEGEESAAPRRWRGGQGFKGGAGGACGV